MTSLEVFGLQSLYSEFQAACFLVKSSLRQLDGFDLVRSLYKCRKLISDMLQKVTSERNVYSKRLPTALLLHIFQYVNYKTCYRAQEVCKQWNKGLTTSHRFWPKIKPSRLSIRWSKEYDFQPFALTCSEENVFVSFWQQGVHILSHEGELISTFTPVTPILQMAYDCKTKLLGIPQCGTLMNFYSTSGQLISSWDIPRYNDATGRAFLLSISEGIVFYSVCEGDLHDCTTYVYSQDGKLKHILPRLYGCGAVDKDEIFVDNTITKVIHVFSKEWKNIRQWHYRCSQNGHSHGFNTLTYQ